jgi:hypothetical protein
MSPGSTRWKAFDAEIEAYCGDRVNRFQPGGGFLLRIDVLDLPAGRLPDFTIEARQPKILP